MSFKTITVHLDDGPRCAVRVALAARLAVRFEGRLVGIAPTGVPDVILTMNSAVPDRVELAALSAAHLCKRAEATAAARAWHRGVRVLSHTLGDQGRRPLQGSIACRARSAS